MVKEFVRGEVKVRRGKLLLSWRGLGEAYVEHNTTHTTRILDPNELDELEEDLWGDPELCEYEHRRATDVFSLIQLDAPPDVELPEEFFTGSRKNNRVTNITQDARWKVGTQGTVDLLDDRLVQALERRSVIEEELIALREEVEQALPGKSPSVVSRYFNELVKPLEDHQEELFPPSMASKLPEELWTHMRGISSLIYDFNTTFGGLSYYREAGGKGPYTLELNLSSLDGLKENRHLTPEELLSSKWLFLDIEVPRFRETSEVSWVTMLFYHDGEVKRQIHTLRDPGVAEVDGYSVTRYETEEELVEAVAREVNKEDPFIVAPYNAPFDLIKLREAGDFLVGSRRSTPKKDTAIQMMERINIYGRQVYDLMKVEKTASRFLPNQKLTTTARHRLGDHMFSKDLDYDQLGELETIAITGELGSSSSKTIQVLQELTGTEDMETVENIDQVAAMAIAHYATRDVDVLPEMVFGTESGRDLLEDYVNICRIFNIELTRAVDSPNAVRDLMERHYLETVGTFRGAVYPNTKRVTEKQEKARQFFKGWLERATPSATPGIHENVYKVFIPVGDYLRYLSNLPGVGEFFEYKYTHLGTSKRQFFLSQFADSLASWLLTDYAEYMMVEEAISKGTERGGMSPGEIERKRRFLTRRERKIRGNYSVYPDDVGRALERMKGKINHFLEDKGFRVVVNQGRYLYLVGGKKEDLDRSPVILVDEIPVLLAADRPYYERHGFIAGHKVTGEPHQMSLFEQEAIQDYLGLVFSGDYRGALESLFFSMDALESGEPDPEELVFYTKSTDTYSGFQDGGRIFFRPTIEGDVEGNGRGKHVQEGDRRVYVMESGELEPDLDLYCKRFESRARDLLEPLVGIGDAARIVHDQLFHHDFERLASQVGPVIF